MFVVVTHCFNGMVSFHFIIDKVIKTITNYPLLDNNCII